MIKTKCNHNPTNTNKGFTLVEIMVTLVIISVIALFAAPLIENFGPNMRLKGSSRDLHTNLEKMKIEAIKRNEHVVMTLNPIFCPPPQNGGGTYSIFIDADRDGNFDVGETQLVMDDQSGDPTPDYDYDMPQNTAICIALGLPGTTSFRFSNRGLWLNAAGNSPGGDTGFRLQNNTGRTYDTTVSVAGGIKTARQ